MRNIMPNNVLCFQILFFYLSIIKYVCSFLQHCSRSLNSNSVNFSKATLEIFTHIISKRICQQKKSRGVRSGEQGGHAIGAAQPLDFFLWGFVKDRVFVPHLPANATELRTRITAAVAEMTPEMLHSVWQDIDYRWDICHITNGSHIQP
jgi:hypothetical protein